VQAETPARATLGGKPARVRPARPTITIVVPAFNEGAGLQSLAGAIEERLKGCDFDWTVFFVDDGSSDQTLDTIRALNAGDPRFSGLSLSRNFGKEMAIAAGLRNARGDAIVLMDADLQHPPEIVPGLVARWREGYDVVFAQREDRIFDSPLRRLYSWAFYSLFRAITPTRLPLGATDFVLLDRVAVDVFNGLDERTRFSKGLCAWIGFKSSGVPFASPGRETGASRWRFFKLVQLALDGLLSFSSLPLKIWSYIGAAISLGAILYAIYFFIRTLLFNVDVPGFPSLIVSIMFFAGVQLVSLGVIGEYLARIFEEVKGRPLFVVAERIGADAAVTETGRQEAKPVAAP
jgi:polyisoprenyl-phosphate glycosyltransferase